MRHRAKIDLENRLLAARDALLSRAPEVKARHAARLAAAREHRRDPRGAADALEAILKSRSYRLDGHRTFDAFVRSELGFSRHTAHRLRAGAASGSARAEEASAAALALGRWLRALGIRPASVKPHRRSSRVTLVLDASDVARLTRARRRPK